MLNCLFKNTKSVRSLAFVSSQIMVKFCIFTPQG